VVLFTSQPLSVIHSGDWHHKEYEHFPGDYRENSLPFPDLPGSQKSNPDKQPLIVDSSDDASGDEPGPFTLTFIFCLRKMNKEPRRSRENIPNRRTK
jgi:hypothetical protein